MQPVDGWQNEVERGGMWRWWADSAQSPSAGPYSAASAEGRYHRIRRRPRKLPLGDDHHRRSRYDAAPHDDACHS